MLNRNEIVSIIEEIKLLIKYAVQSDERDKAESLVDEYKDNHMALILLKEFYSFLPEAREEPVIRIVQIDMHQGVFLLGVSTGSHEYIFLATDDEAENLGEYKEKVGDEQAFAFFGYSDKESFLADHPSMTEFQDLGTDFSADEVFCPVCSVAVGENHHLGCPVEICPWCFGQLNRCNCRFDQMEKEEMEGEEDLEMFERILNEKGRICFEPGQGPSYPAAGKKQK